MLKETRHFLRETPLALRLQKQMEPLDLFEYVETALDEAGKFGWRASLVADLVGDILEIGCGTGMMFPHYRSGVRLTATDPDEPSLLRARERAKQSEAEVKLQMAWAERLPFPDTTFDAIVVSNVLCTVQSVEQALAEAKRVLKSGGHLRLLEHVESDRPIPRLLMHAFNPVWLAVNKLGCNMNLDAEAAARKAGFRVLEVEPCQFFAKGYPFAFPYRSIRAVRP